MKRLLLLTALALCLGGTVAQAQWTGTSIGQNTFWHNNTGQSVTCTRIGNNTFCN